MDSATAGRFEPRAPRRVVTAPVSVPAFDHPVPQTNGAVIETLYVHPDVKIVTFNAGQENVAEERNSIDSLTWSSRQDRTIAVGSFRIYRAPGSVAFLSCGAALKPIMPKGQCWSITDDNSKFVLQIRPPTYWRIELPVDTPECLEMARRLREVFDAVLQFEKTPCPFERPFTVSLPEPSLEPVRKKAWTPSQRSASVDYSKVVAVPALPTKVLGNPPRSAPRATVRSDKNSRPRADDSLSGPHENTSATSLDRTSHPESACSPVLPNETLGFADSRDLFEAAHETTSRCEIVQHRCPTPLSLRRDPCALSLQDTSDPPTTYGPALRHSSGRLAPDDPRGGQGADQPDASASMEQKASGGGASLGALDDDSRALGTIKSRPRRRHTGFGTLHSDPTAPQLTLITSPPSKATQRSVVGGIEPSLESLNETGGVSPTYSQESFYSTRDSISPTNSLPPSPPSIAPDDGFASIAHMNTCITGLAVGDSDMESSNLPATPRTGSALSRKTDAMDDTPTQSCRQADTTPTRAKPSRRGDGAQVTCVSSENATEPLLSVGQSTDPDQTMLMRRPLPPGVALPERQKNREGRMSSRSAANARLRTLPMSLLIKTCGLLLGPPSFLAALMLRIAARIAAGEWKGTAIGYDPTGDQIPVDWYDFDSEWEDDLRADRVERKEAPFPRQSIKHSLETEDDSEVESFVDANQNWETD